LGRLQHYIEKKINATYVKSQAQQAPINENDAIERGITFFYEIVFYALIFTLPALEILRQARESHRSLERFERCRTEVEEQSAEMIEGEALLKNQLRELQTQTAVSVELLHMIHSLSKANSISMGV
jgi:cytochrome b561